jgi:hypothetical protein
MESQSISYFGAIRESQPAQFGKYSVVGISELTTIGMDFAWKMNHMHWTTIFVELLVARVKITRPMNLCNLVPAKI